MEADEHPSHSRQDSHYHREYKRVLEQWGRQSSQICVFELVPAPGQILCLDDIHISQLTLDGAVASNKGSPVRIFHVLSVDVFGFCGQAGKIPPIGVALAVLKWFVKHFWKGDSALVADLRWFDLADFGDGVEEETG